MQPAFFGSSEARLFGVYQAPLGNRDRESGVLLCYPGPQEYMRCHWAFRKLAALLARDGFHVLRFDYSGTGDSAGETGSGSLAAWRLDIASALQELKDLGGLRRVSLVGFRLGAALAAQAPLKLRDLVLWEPVLDGRAHLVELARQHVRRFKHCLYPPPLEELLGQPLPVALRTELEALELRAPLTCRADRVALVTTHDDLACQALAESLRAQTGTGGEPPHVEWRLVADAGAGAEDDAFLLSTHAQQAIVSWLGGRSA
jgi:pimeloyl-ACP methyl ester carboxylesterase